MNTPLQTELLEAVVYSLNEAAPDTLNEGDSGNWFFSKLIMKQKTLTLHYENDWGEASISVELDINLSDEKLKDGSYFDSCVQKIEAHFYQKLPL